MPFSDKLQAGNVNFHFYDKTTGEYNSSGMLDFDPATPGIQNFDPDKHSLEDVRDAINNMVDADGNPIAPPPLNASIQDGKLIIETNPAADVTFGMGADSTGLMAALGINTFFSGDSADNLAVNSQVHSNANLIASGQVNGQHQPMRATTPRPRPSASWPTRKSPFPPSGRRWIIRAFPNITPTWSPPWARTGGFPRPIPSTTPP